MTFSLLFLSVSLAQGLPPGLLDSVCYVESSHNPRAIVLKDGDGKPSVGICQLKYATARRFSTTYGPINLIDPIINVTIAGKYLAHQIKRYKNVRRGVCSYNKGSSHSHGNNKYTRKVFREWERRLCS